MGGRKQRTYPYKGYIMKSRLEVAIAEELDFMEVAWEYETKKIGYTRNISKSKCPKCGHQPVVQMCSYTPDFWLPEYNFFIEGKGRWDGTNRKMHRSILEQHDLDMRFVFERNNWLTKNKANSYGSWCDSKGLKWHVCEKLGRSGIIVGMPTNWFK